MTAAESGLPASACRQVGSEAGRQAGREGGRAAAAARGPRTGAARALRSCRRLCPARVRAGCVLCPARKELRYKWLRVEDADNPPKHVYLMNQASISLQCSRGRAAALEHLSSLWCFATASVTLKEVPRWSRYNPPAVVAHGPHPCVDCKFARVFSLWPVSTLLTVAPVLNRVLKKSVS